MKKHENDIRVASSASEKEKNFRKEFINNFKNCPIPEEELLHNYGVWR